MSEVPIVFAFTAGLISFLAPCVLPLIPGYLAYLSGTSLDQAENNRWQVFFNSVFFVLGFSLVFATLGVLLNTLLEAIAYDVQEWMSRIGGIVVIIFGLYLTNLLKIPFLEREYKPLTSIATSFKFPSKYLTSLIFGAAFAAGWTPCVGAVLGSILGLAASQPGLAFWLLLAYSIGLGIPFLIVGLFATHASRWISRFSGSLKYINIIFGVLLIIFGILIFTQTLSLIANFELLNQFLLSQ